MSFKRRSLFALVTAVSALALMWGPVAAAPIVREAYEWEDAGSWDDCGLPLTFEAYGSGVFMLKQGRAGDPTPYLSDNYEWHFINRNPANGKWFREDGHALYKDLRIRNAGGTVYSFEAIEVGSPYTVTTSAGRKIVMDRGLLHYQFDVDTLGDGDLDNDVHLTFHLLRDSGSHPIWHQSFEDYCDLVNDLLG